MENIQAFSKKAGSVLHKGLDVFLKDLGVFLKAERVLKKDLGLFWGEVVV